LALSKSLDINYNSQSITPTMSIEEIKSTALTISYDNLMRNNENYIGKIVYFRGKIDQVSEVYSNKYILRIATKESEYFDYSGDSIWVNYEGKRLLEEDIVDIWGSVKGLKTYTAILGNGVTVPDVDSLWLELIKKAGD